MESPLTMGEAGDSFKEKSKSTEDIFLNGDLSSDEPMDISDSKPSEETEVNVSPKNCSEKVPGDKVPDENEANDDDSEEEEEAMDVDLSADEDNGSDVSGDDNGVSKDTENEDESNAKTDERVTVSGDVEDEVTKETVEETDEDERIKETEEEDEDEDNAKDDEEYKDDDNHDSIASPTATSAPPAQNGTTTDVNGTINLDDDEDDKELNNSDDVVFVQNDSHTKENGDLCSNSDIEEVINLSDKDTVTPKKLQDDIVNLVSPAKKKVKKSMDRLSDPPRRSTRNLHKNKSYVEKDDDPDVEEVTPEDPLADPLRDDKENKKIKIVPASSTIVVSDTKRLVEIAANSKSTNSSGGKKEPTLVIIDTNSILSGRGPVPVSHKSSPSLPASYSMLPVALPAQGVYPPNMRATITPIPMKQAVTSSPAVVTTPILPTLTDDMYVVEAPSFIVPYVYEKPPIKPFKDFVQKMHEEIIADERAKAAEKKLKAVKLASKTEDTKSMEDDSDEDMLKDETEKKVAVDKDDKEYKVADDDDEGESDTEQVKEMKESETKEKTINLDDIPDPVTETPKPKSSSYFDNALGQFFINIGYGLVQEFVQTDLLKQTKRKQKSVGTAPETKQAITSLIKNLEYSKENNEPYKLDQKRCEFCSFKTESALVLAHHMETPHMRNYVYKCNFCPLEVRSPHDILFHMEAEHNTRGRLERAPAFHQCPSCSFEDNQKGKLSRHLVTCVKKYKPERNLEPPTDWEPPAKIPRVPRIKQQGLTATAATYQALTQAKGNYQLFTKLQAAASPQAFARGRGRPTLSNIGKINSVRPQNPIIRTNMMYRPSTSGGSVLVPTTYQFGGNQIFQVLGGQSDLGSGRLSGASQAPVALVPNLAPQQSSVTIQNSSGSKSSTGKVVQQPSISITPLPRQPASSTSSSSTTITKTSGAAGDTSSKATFVICEICDGYIKDLEQLRNHMQWIHKVKIHPKMIYNRPPLNCQKCQFRFFTDQGLERHLLGSHGLVTSSMQEAANKSKDAGRCPVCGRVYQWKLLNHVARDHNMTLKPAHLSYKCTVCTATFGMYKQFENHVYSAHSVVAKRVMDKKGSATPTSLTSTAVAVAAAAAAGQQRDSLLKPLKINDEITIIPQPAKSKTKTPAAAGTSGDRGK